MYLEVSNLIEDQVHNKLIEWLYPLKIPLQGSLNTRNIQNNDPYNDVSILP